MKILVIVLGFLDKGRSGGDKHVLDLASEWSTSHDVTLLLPDFVQHLVPPDTKSITLPSRMPKGLASTILIYLQRILRGMRMAREIPADVVICSPGLFDLLPALAHNRAHRSFTTCYWFHLLPERTANSVTKYVRNQIAILAERIAVRASRFVRCFFTSNSIERNRLIGRGIPAERIHLQVPSVNLSAIRAAQPLPAPQILFVGRLVRAKGVYDLIEAVRDLTYSVGMIGDGEERESLEALVQRWGINSRLTFKSGLTEQELYGLLRGCSIFVLPSYEEGYGIAIAEAIAAGKPVVAYELPHYHEVFAGSIVTAPPGNITMLKEHIRRLIEYPPDPAELANRYKSVRLREAHEAARHEWHIIQKDREKWIEGR